MSKTRVISAAELARKVEKAKQNGQKVVFSNGIFDFLHAGHVDYLTRARALGDLLVLGINSNASTARIKGPSRPINDEMDRAQVLASLRAVDYVTVFDEDTPAALLDLVKPSIHCKGGDYEPEKMPETATVRRHGGEVVVLPLKSGYSNSSQFAKIKQSDNDNFTRPAWLAGAAQK